MSDEKAVGLYVCVKSTHCVGARLLEYALR